MSAGSVSVVETSTGGADSDSGDGGDSDDGGDAGDGDDSDAGDDSDGDSGSSDGIPGFGASTALVALAAGLLLVRRLE